MKYLRKFLIACLICVLLSFILYQYYQYRWSHLWAFENEREPYQVARHEGDTIRIAMIGDSWAAMRSRDIDNALQSKLNNKTKRPVEMVSKGKGGEKSRGIYQLLFEENNKDGTKTIIASGLDYCIISAGINDAAANLGPHQYSHHMRLILNLLLSNNICPILIEIPDVNIWHVYKDKPLKDLASDYIRSFMSHCNMYQIKEYRDSLQAMLEKESHSDSVIYIRLSEWNGNCTTINKMLFLPDQIHLNENGYELLDSCIVNAIEADLNSREPK